MKKNITLSMLLIICMTELHAQTFQWAVRMGLSGSSTATGLITDGAGSVYTTGYFSGTVDFDPGPATYNLNSSGGEDIFVTKVDGNGNFVWARKMGGSLYDRGNSITTDGAYLYITGSFEGTANFDAAPNIANLTSAGSADVFVLKIDNSGALSGASRMGGSSSDAGNSISIGSGGAVYVTGNFSGTFNANTAQGVVTLTSAGGDDVFVASFVGVSLAWVVQTGGADNDSGNGIAVNSTGQLLCTGSFGSVVDFDPGVAVVNMTSAGSRDIYVLKLSSTGLFQWAKQLGGTGDDIGRGIARDNSNNIYTTGSFQGTADFNPAVGVTNLVSAGGADIFISKLDNSGTYVWAKSSGGSGSDIGFGVKTDASNNVYATGAFSSSCDFDPSAGVYPLQAAGSTDIFIMKSDASGNFIWAKGAGGTGADYGYGIFVPSTSVIYTAGSFSGTADFDPGPNTFNLTAAGGSNIFILKLNGCGSGYATASFTGCDSVVINGIQYNNTGYYTQLYNNISGCDSNTVYNVTVHPAYNLSPAYSTCDSITIGNQTYNATGIYTQNLTSVWGCDSILTIHITVNTPTTNTITVTACDTLTLNGQGYNASGTYVQTLVNAAGCDSILTVNLTVKNSSSSVVNAAACYSYSLNGLSYTNTGTYLQTFQNAVGCDSIVTLNLVINDTTYFAMNQVACTSFVLNGQTYNASGTYNQTLINAAGCDSILTLNLTVNQPSAHTITQTACKLFALNGQTYNTSGVYTQNLTNAAGCDSVITLNLTINNVNTAVTQTWGGLMSNAATATYQWMRCNPFQQIPGEVNQNFSPGAIGYFAVAVTENGCTDTSACYTVNAVGINDYFQSSAFSLYPNPVKGMLQIVSAKALQNASIKIFNMVGQQYAVVHHVSGTQYDLDMSSFMRGIYLVEIVEAGSKVVKIVTKE